jgi:tetratricopeptide (TPR) repeat protein
MKDADTCFANEFQGRRIASELVVEACSGLLAKAGDEFTLRNEARIRNNRGTAYLDIGQLDAALADFNAALKIEPGLIEAATNRASIFLKQRNFDQAIADYSAVISREPSHISAIVNRGVAHLKNHELDAAIADFDTARRMDGDSYAARINKSLALLEKGDVSGARAEADSAMAVHPTYFWSHNLQCLIMASTRQDLAGAERECNEAQRISGNNYAVFHSVGLVKYQMGQYREAVAAYDKFIKAEPNEPVALYMRGLAKRRLGDAAGADRDLAASRALDPKVEAIYSSLGGST